VVYNSSVVKTTFYAKIGVKHPRRTPFYTNFSIECRFNNTGIVNHGIPLSNTADVLGLKYRYYTSLMMA